MTEKIDVLALAREAGFEVYCDKKQNRHAWVEGVRCTPDLVKFAALVLERAAVECEKQMFAEDDVYAERIRALKPNQEA